MLVRPFYWDSNRFFAEINSDLSWQRLLEAYSNEPDGYDRVLNANGIVFSQDDFISINQPWLPSFGFRGEHIRGTFKLKHYLMLGSASLEPAEGLNYSFKKEERPMPTSWQQHLINKAILQSRLVDRGDEKVVERAAETLNMILLALGGHASLGQGPIFEGMNKLLTSHLGITDDVYQLLEYLSVTFAEAAQLAKHDRNK